MARLTAATKRSQAKKKPTRDESSGRPVAKSRDEAALQRMDAASVAVRRIFSANLQKKLGERGWNGAELARQAAKFMEDGRFGRDTISRYLRGLSMPYASSLDAMCRALRCDPKDLIPPEAYQTLDSVVPEIDMQAAPDGQAWLRVNKKVPMRIAIEVIKLLGGAAE